MFYELSMAQQYDVVYPSGRQRKLGQVISSLSGSITVREISWRHNKIEPIVYKYLERLIFFDPFYFDR